MAKEPKAAKVARIGLAMTLSPIANIAGMTIAVRAARRSAPWPGSRSLSHSQPGTDRRRRGSAEGTVIAPLPIFGAPLYL